MVYKMASVGSVRDNSCCEESNEDFVKKTFAGINDMCKKNGLSQQCSCGENPIKNFHIKRVKPARLNGIRPPSIPTLRSRTAPSDRRVSLLEYPLQKRRSPRTEKSDNVDGSLLSRSDSVDTNCSYGSTASSEPCTPEDSRSCTPQPLSLAPLLRPSDAANSDSNSRLSDLDSTNNSVKDQTHRKNHTFHSKSFVKFHYPHHTNHNKTETTKNCVHGSNAVPCTLSTQAQNNKLNKPAACEFSNKHNGDSTFPTTRNHLVCPVKRDLHVGSESLKKCPLPTTDTSSCTISKPSTSSANCDQPKVRTSADKVRSECDKVTGGGNKVKKDGDKIDGKNSSEDTKDSSITCKWNNCGVVVDASDLMMHIRDTHVETQRKSEVFLCLWEGCKVYNKPSCSLSWLERHVVSHSGDKPFKCIVDGCGLRFTSQGALERHINSHFNVNASNQPKSSRSAGDTPSKTLKKRKTRKRKSVRIKTDDFFDTGIMERIKQHIVSINQVAEIDTLGSGKSVTFRSSVIARRTDETGKVSVCLRWNPTNVLPDSWVPESQVQFLQEKVIPLSQLPPGTIANLHPSLYRQHRYRKHKRK